MTFCEIKNGINKVSSAEIISTLFMIKVCYFYLLTFFFPAMYLSQYFVHRYKPSDDIDIMIKGERQERGVPQFTSEYL